jgi:hypothetical protein
MPGFACTLNISNLPAEVRRGSSITGTVTAVSCNAPIRSVVIASDSYGISQRLRKVNENTFQLDLKVPFLVPAGKFNYSVWAVSESGESSARQAGSVVIR